MVIFGLGSNLGDRLAYLKRAVADLSEILTNKKTSPVYESEAILLAGAPESWNIPFLNAAVCGETSLSPEELLAYIKSIERKIGRAENHSKWSPREIDIDILAIDDLVLSSENLTIPHPFLLDRPFALWPLADIAPDWEYHGKKACNLRNKFQNPATRLTNYNL